MSKYAKEIDNFNEQESGKKYSVRFVEQQFNIKMPPWIYNFALKLTHPVKAYTWLMASEKYSVEWDEEKRIMNFLDDGSRYKFAQWGMNKVKQYLGKDVYEHFGKITFTVNGAEEWVK
jgi:hypothetical protein